MTRTPPPSRHPPDPPGPDADRETLRRYVIDARLAGIPATTTAALLGPAWTPQRVNMLTVEPGPLPADGRQPTRRELVDVCTLARKPLHATWDDRAARLTQLDLALQRLLDDGVSPQALADALPDTPRAGRVLILLHLNALLTARPDGRAADS